MIMSVIGVVNSEALGLILIISLYLSVCPLAGFSESVGCIFMKFLDWYTSAKEQRIKWGCRDLSVWFVI